MDETIARQQRRFRFLSALYDKTEANINVLVDLAEFFRELGISPKEGAEALNYLVPKRLVKWGGGGGTSGWASITLEGIDAVEAARTNPTAPTQHFAPLVQINVAQMSHSIIQTGAGSTATVTQEIGPEDRAKLLDALEKIRQTLNAQGVDRAELVELVGEIQAEAKKPKPNRFKLWPNLQTIALAIRTASDLRPAYEALRGLLAIHAGIDWPDWPLG